MRELSWARRRALLLFFFYRIDSFVAPFQSHNNLVLDHTTSRWMRMSRRRTRDASSKSTVTPESSSSSTSYSNFWYSTIRHDTADNETSSRLPCVPSLDRDGPLPPGAYLLHGDPQYEPKPTCRISIAVDLLKQRTEDDMDTSNIVKNMQQCLDSGLTTFQLKGMQKWGEENIYCRLIDETPSFALQQCHLVVPFWTPSKFATNVNAVSIRKSVSASLSRMGADCIDSIQLQYYQDSPYHLDVLDVLQDLKREGYLRSVSGRNLPPHLLRSAASCGFPIDSNQLDINLLDPSAYTMEQQLACSDLKSPLFVASPLAGGLLSNRHFGTKFEPLSYQLTSSERRHLKTTLRKWGKQHDAATRQTLWNEYQSKFLTTLHDIALKHRVSIASVALRWSLQLEHVESAVVACRFSTMAESLSLPPRPQQLRQVFTFELDEDDMERLWYVSGKEPPPPVRDGEDEEELLMEMMQSENGLFLPS